MKKTIILGILSCLVFAGCSTVNTVERANPIGAKRMVNDKRIITDGGLDDYAYVAGVNEGIVSGNLLKIQVEVVNSSTAYRSFNYKFEWFDENGMQVPGTTSTWVTTSIEGGEKKFISAVAPNPRVKDFSLKMLPKVRDE